jgi:hypothetical protein
MMMTFGGFLEGVVVVVETAVRELQSSNFIALRLIVDVDRSVVGVGVPVVFSVVVASSSLHIYAIIQSSPNRICKPHPSLSNNSTIHPNILIIIHTKEIFVISG